MVKIVKFRIKIYKWIISKLKREVWKALSYFMNQLSPSDSFPCSAYFFILSSFVSLAVYYSIERWDMCNCRCFAQQRSSSSETKLKNVSNSLFLSSNWYPGSHESLVFFVICNYHHPHRHKKYYTSFHVFCAATQIWNNKLHFW